MSRADVLRPEAEARIDWHYARKINDLIGPLGALHQRKVARAIAARNSAVRSFADEADRLAIIAVASQDKAIAALDVDRRRMKADVRAADTAAAINVIPRKLEIIQ
ncbi:hypothetical protein B5V02_00365 [Mesorhizobium kowhaii]|uniref:Uncharacterized protein n=1 Tax=Mesorhizobium kowhaii TaxID=1300272 RepID=A0A2W7D315_9HYPH|nr:hypothetical protein B5V02_00365 [Mesorhizobium kowhaii]